MDSQGQVPRGGGRRQMELGQQVLGVRGVTVLEPTREFPAQALSSFSSPRKRDLASRCKSNTGHLRDL